MREKYTPTFSSSWYYNWLHLIICFMFLILKKPLLYDPLTVDCLSPDTSTCYRVLLSYTLLRYFFILHPLAICFLNTLNYISAMTGTVISLYSLPYLPILTISVSTFNIFSIINSCFSSAVISYTSISTSVRIPYTGILTIATGWKTNFVNWIAVYWVILHCSCQIIYWNVISEQIIILRYRDSFSSIN